jgi:hypothetical protein
MDEEREPSSLASPGNRALIARNVAVSQQDGGGPVALLFICHSVHLGAKTKQRELRC